MPIAVATQGCSETKEILAMQIGIHLTPFFNPTERPPVAIAACCARICKGRPDIGNIGPFCIFFRPET